MSELNKYLENIGIRKGQHVMVHTSFRRLRSAFPGITIEQFIESLKQKITKQGSLIMPAFTYCFKRSNDEHEIFDHEKSPGKVGAVPEVFRQNSDVIRTSSPTHSFSLWGRITEKISEDNSPASPLGAGSVLDWMTNQTDSFIFLVGVDFRSLSYGHYLEIMSGLPWADISPWDYMQVEKIGISTAGEQALRELPGCSKPFKNFEKYLVNQQIISYHDYKWLKSLYLPVKLLYHEGLKYFTSHRDKLLCPAGSCKACDTRRKQLKEKM
ncbi:MAG: AAC(3) family N-acetyltransferase [Fidelibacterota bacterium]